MHMPERRGIGNDHFGGEWQCCLVVIGYACLPGRGENIKVWVWMKSLANQQEVDKDNVVNNK